MCNTYSYFVFGIKINDEAKAVFFFLTICSKKKKKCCQFSNILFLFTIIIDQTEAIIYTRSEVFKF